jgi:hypothetical protein
MKLKSIWGKWCGNGLPDFCEYPFKERFRICLKPRMIVRFTPSMKSILRKPLGVMPLHDD